LPITSVYAPSRSLQSPSASVASIDLTESPLGEGLRPENKKTYPALDGLRGVAVLLVFVEHYCTHVTPQSLRYGWVGVDIFFVLSGFLITGILYDTREAAHRFRNFYVRRSLRIFPLYYGVLLLGLLLSPMFHWVWHPAWYLYPVYLGNYARFLYLGDFLRNTGVLEGLRSQLHLDPPFVAYLGHLWSLCVEEQFYLVWPFVIFYIKDRRRLRNLCAIVCPLVLLARVICVLMLPTAMLHADFLYRTTPFRVDALLLGGFVALALRGPEATQLVRSARPVLLGVFAICCGLQVFHFLIYHAPFLPVVASTFMRTVGFSLIDIMAVAILVLALNPKTVVYRLLCGKRLRRFGQMSYGFYLFHDIPHYAYGRLAHLVAGDRFALQGPLTVLFALTGTIILSYVSFRFFEAPFLRLKERFAPSLL
jgi:peptidoglycan/LPS O-acetylase OafA/YrhL